MSYKIKSIPNKGLLNPNGLRTRLALSSISSLACLRSSLSSGLLNPIGLRLLPKDPKTLKNSKIRTIYIWITVLRIYLFGRGRESLLATWSLTSGRYKNKECGRLTRNFFNKSSTSSSLPLFPRFDIK